MKNIYLIIKCGIQDGYEQPLDLTSGLTYPDDWKNELYDSSVNIGQFFGRLFKSI